jgi:hypothetical protein
MMFRNSRFHLSDEDMKMIAGDGGRDEEWKLLMEVDVYWRLSIKTSS